MYIGTLLIWGGNAEEEVTISTVFSPPFLGLNIANAIPAPMTMAPPTNIPVNNEELLLIERKEEYVYLNLETINFFLFV
jgi:hypothetical protein